MNVSDTIEIQTENMDTKRGRGRPAGAKNKVSAQLREMITGFCERHFEQITKDFDQLEPKDRIRLYSDLLPYCIARLASTESTISIESMSDATIDELINQLMNDSAYEPTD